MAGRLESTEALPFRAEIKRLYFKDGGPFDNGIEWKESILSKFIQFRDSEDATHAARVLVPRMVSIGYPPLLELPALLSVAPRPEVRQRTLAVAGAAGTAANGVLTMVPNLLRAAEPWPCRFTTQELIELLKMPTCIGDTRRLILDHLGNRYRRRFDTHWDFVRYAEEQHLNLDFTTPPKRPDAKLPDPFAE